jgi:hypothetical protein
MINPNARSARSTETALTLDPDQPVPYSVVDRGLSEPIPFSIPGTLLSHPFEPCTCYVVESLQVTAAE